MSRCGHAHGHTRMAALRCCWHDSEAVSADLVLCVSCCGLANRGNSTAAPVCIGLKRSPCERHTAVWPPEYESELEVLGKTWQGQSGVVVRGGGGTGGDWEDWDTSSKGRCRKEQKGLVAQRLAMRATPCPAVAPPRPPTTASPATGWWVWPRATPAPPSWPLSPPTGRRSRTTCP